MSEVLDNVKLMIENFMKILDDLEERISHSSVSYEDARRLDFLLRMLEFRIKELCIDIELLYGFDLDEIIKEYGSLDI